MFFCADCSHVEQVPATPGASSTRCQQHQVLLSPRHGRVPRRWLRVHVALKYVATAPLNFESAERSRGDGHVVRLSAVLRDIPPRLLTHRLSLLFPFAESVLIVFLVWSDFPFLVDSVMEGFLSRCTAEPWVFLSEFFGVIGMLVTGARR